MAPWMVNWSQAIGRDIIGVRDMQHMFAAFDPSSLLQGDLRSTIAALAQGIQWGIYCPDDARAKLGENPRGRSPAERSI
jgi:phage portal protein BeeE